MNRPAVVALVASLPLAACMGMAHGPSDQGVTSPTHSAHIGGIVFSNAVIAHGQENPAAFVDHCVLGQPCYGRFYLKSSLREDSGYPYIGAIALRATVDGKPMPDGKFAMTAWWSTYNFTLFRADGDTMAWEHPRWFLDKVARELSPGEHVLELTVLAVPPGTNAGAGKPLATGRIGLTVPASSQAIIAAALARENQLAASEQQEASAQEAATNAEDARPGHYKLSNGCDHAVTFLFAGCGVDKKLVSVGAGQDKPLSLPMPAGGSCEVCIAAAGECKMLATMLTKDMTEVSVSASAGCDAPSAN